MQEEDVWTPVLDIPDEEFWKVRQQNKQTLLAYLHEYARRRWASGEVDPKQVVASGPFLQPEPLTIGFARRFATYKRATLMFSDPDRLARILTDPERPVQLIFAGKAHPADDGGKRLIQEIFWRSLDPRFQGRIAFAEDYDMLLASRLYGGVDVWLNNPRAPLEASGTSGMKAAANGALNLSVLDGWWIEGFAANPDTGWGIEPSEQMDGKGDAADGDAIYALLERRSCRSIYERDEQNLPPRVDSPVERGYPLAGAPLLIAADGDRIHQSALRARLGGRGALGGAAGDGRPGAGLGRKALDDPVIALPAIAQPVMEPAGTSLPELDRLRDHAVATPEFG